jgi:glyoxylase-like metal-dependent hydrolase (beta-lactamase superfamily II)
MPAEEAADNAARVRVGDVAIPLIEPDRILSGGEELRVGDYAFEFQWTPGHTPGHVCLYEPGHRLLLCGDHILQDVAPNVSLQPYTTENPIPGYLSSMQWLSELPVDVSMPGHGQPFASPRERALALIGHQTERAEQVRSLLTHEPQTTYELAAQVWANTTPYNWSQFNVRLRRNALGTLAAHLDLLAQRRQAERIEDNGVVAFAAA